MKCAQATNTNMPHWYFEKVSSGIIVFTLSVLACIYNKSFQLLGVTVEFQISFWVSSDLSLPACHQGT
jgi:hypothetical protein